MSKKQHISEQSRYISSLLAGTNKDPKEVEPMVKQVKSILPHIDELDIISTLQENNYVVEDTVMKLTSNQGSRWTTVGKKPKPKEKPTQPKQTTQNKKRQKDGGEKKQQQQTSKAQKDASKSDRRPQENGGPQHKLQQGQPQQQPHTQNSQTNAVPQSNTPSSSTASLTQTAPKWTAVVGGGVTQTPLQALNAQSVPAPQSQQSQQQKAGPVGAPSKQHPVGHPAQQQSTTQTTPAATTGTQQQPSGSAQQQQQQQQRGSYRVKAQATTPQNQQPSPNTNRWKPKEATPKTTTTPTSTTTTAAAPSTSTPPTQSSSQQPIAQASSLLPNQPQQLTQQTPVVQMPPFLQFGNTPVVLPASALSLPPTLDNFQFGSLNQGFESVSISDKKPTTTTAAQSQTTTTSAAQVASQNDSTKRINPIPDQLTTPLEPIPQMNPYTQYPPYAMPGSYPPFPFDNQDMRAMYDPSYQPTLPSATPQTIDSKSTRSKQGEKYGTTTTDQTQSQQQQQHQQQQQQGPSNAYYGAPVYYPSPYLPPNQFSYPQQAQYYRTFYQRPYPNYPANSAFQQGGNATGYSPEDLSQSSFPSSVPLGYYPADQSQANTGVSNKQTQFGASDADPYKGQYGLNQESSFYQSYNPASQGFYGTQTPTQSQQSSSQQGQQSQRQSGHHSTTSGFSRAQTNY